MSDRSSQAAFDYFLALLAENPTPETKELARKVVAFSLGFDFDHGDFDSKDMEALGLSAICYGRDEEEREKFAEWLFELRKKLNMKSPY